MASHNANLRALQELVVAHPVISGIMSRWHLLKIPDAWLSGSIIAQARWNECFGLDPLHGIADADIVYFDPDDLSEEAEVQAAERVRRLLSDFSVQIDTKNEARVHLWYGAKNGQEIQPYQSVAEAIATFPTTSSAVGVRWRSGFEVLAPFGLEDLLLPVVRANATQITEAIYERKARRWRETWAALEILPWSEAALISCTICESL